MKVIIKEDVLKQLFDALSSTVAVDDSRPQLQTIRLEVTKTELRAYATDGYAASKFIYSQANDEEFVCYVRPVSMRKFKGTRPRDVVIELKDGNTTMTMPHRYGNTIYVFPVTEWDYKLESIFGKNELKHKVHLNAGMLGRLLRATAKADVTKYADVCLAEEQGAPVIVIAKGKKAEVAHLLLPVKEFR